MARDLRKEIFGWNDNQCKDADKQIMRWKEYTGEFITAKLSTEAINKLTSLEQTHGMSRSELLTKLFEGDICKNNNN